MPSRCWRSWRRPWSTSRTTEKHPARPPGVIRKSGAGCSAAPATRGRRRREFRHIGLLIRRRVIRRWRRAAILKKGDAAEARLTVAPVLATVFLSIGLVPTTALVLRAALALAVALSIAVGLLRLASLPLLRGAGLSLFAAVAPTLVVALDEAALGLNHAEIVVGILPVCLGHDAITR